MFKISNSQKMNQKKLFVKCIDEEKMNAIYFMTQLAKAFHTQNQMEQLYDIIKSSVPASALIKPNAMTIKKYYIQMD